jgi:hypothetical protein
VRDHESLRFAFNAEHEPMYPCLISAWLVPNDISKLPTHEIEAYISEPCKRSGDLRTGYRVALDPKKWEEEHKESFIHTVDDEPEIDELDSEEEGSDDKKQAKSEKRKRFGCRYCSQVQGKTEGEEELRRAFWEEKGPQSQV